MGRWSGRSRSYALVVCATLGMFFALQTCAPPPPDDGMPTLRFGQGESDCAEGEAMDQATITVQGMGIMIAGVVIAGSPCQHLVPEVWIDEDTVTLAVAAVPQPGTCVLCVGAIDYAARLSGLDPGSYRVAVEHGGETVAEAEVSLSDDAGP